MPCCKSVNRILSLRTHRNIISGVHQHTVRTVCTLRWCWKLTSKIQFKFVPRLSCQRARIIQNFANGRTVTCKVNSASFQRSNQKSFVNSIAYSHRINLLLLCRRTPYVYTHTPDTRHRTPYTLHTTQWARFAKRVVFTYTITTQRTHCTDLISHWRIFTTLSAAKPIERKPNLKCERLMLGHRQRPFILFRFEWCAFSI